MKRMTLDDLRVCTEELKKYFWCQLTLLKGVTERPLKARAGEIKILLASTCTTGTAIYQLGDKPEYFYSEMVMLGRSFIEKIINFCYAILCDDKEYQKFLLHPLYRAYHRMDKRIKFSERTLSMPQTGEKEFKKLPRVAKALNLFSETNPRMSWSNKTVDQKVEFIKIKSGINMGMFLLNVLLIYSDASEALHGTFFGASFHTGVFDSGVNHKDKNEVNRNLFRSLAQLYAQFGSNIHDVIKILSKDNDLSVFLEHSKKNQKPCSEILKVIFQEPSPGSEGV